jgi:hypothetical protein
MVSWIIMSEKNWKKGEGFVWYIIAEALINSKTWE